MDNERKELEETSKKNGSSVNRPAEMQSAEQIAKTEKVKELEHKKLMDERFENQIAVLVDVADDMSRDYELEIKKGHFEVMCPYPEIIRIYENVKEMLAERGWHEQTHIYSQQIKHYRDKLEKDEKLRELEAQKAQKQHEYETMHKVDDLNLMESILDSLDMEDRVLDFEEKKQAQIDESEEILKIINEAERKAREYDHTIKGGQILKHNCPYEEIITIYKEAKRRFVSIGWNVEASNLTNSIRFYQKKLKQDKKLREFEEKKRRKNH